ncbi:MAG: Smr/MutS family protein [Candidatus Magnetobacterium sp. LHC-1]|uniref:Smr/MutS family protein n=1 Tax=Candidatus Magnetobacterium casense TaxID=1455061 RepID=A0ABS6S0V8_9BACT|nr:Smr/MutS family protein [Candidatus Magnetobacterium casensis]MBF0609408.1 Smr/MutS family protein [Nitrospirota bacterium]MBV6342277.1 Smr/MutS family protein [Candidatus Magnetobacterium casensis]
MSEEFAHRPFDELGGLLKGKMALRRQKEPKKVAKAAVETVAPEMTDEELFREAMLNVKEIKEFTQIPYSRGKLKPPPCKDDDDDYGDKECLDTLRAIRDGKRPIDIRKTQEYIEWNNPAHRNVFTLHLHEGRYSVQDFLDLHGSTLAEAELIITDFIKESVRKSHRCVKIIHGRGLRSPNGPVLKNAITGWLSGRMRKYVMAFATAPQYDGGLGALYILLKKG